jgi:arylsulfatase
MGVALASAYRRGSTISEALMPLEKHRLGVSAATTRLADERHRSVPRRASYVYASGTQAVPENVAVKVLDGRFMITAICDIPAGGAEGVIICHGSARGGQSLFIQGGQVSYAHNYLGIVELRVDSGVTVPEGTVCIRFEFEATARPPVTSDAGAPGIGRLYFDEQLVGERALPVTIPLALGRGAVLTTVGRNPGSSVSSMYEPPFPFSGAIRSVVYDRLDGRPTPSVVPSQW